MLGVRMLARPTISTGGRGRDRPWWSSWGRAAGWSRANGRVGVAAPPLPRVSRM